MEQEENTSKKTSGTEAEDLNIIENHKKIAEHLKEAAKKHITAAKHHEEGDYEKAHDSTMHAQNHTALATEAQMELLKHYPFTS